MRRMWTPIILTTGLSGVLAGAMFHIGSIRGASKRTIGEQHAVVTGGHSPTPRVPAPSLAGSLASSSASPLVDRNERTQENETAQRAGDDNTDRVITEEERRVYAASAFDAEAVDGDWALQARRSLEATLPALLGRAGRMESVECRRSLCRLSLEHADARTQQVFLRDFVRSSAWKGPGMAVQDSDDNANSGTPARVTVYLVREGGTIPEPQL